MRIPFLDLDSLRPDHLGCYGYHRDTSPNIDAIAAQGVRFSNYYCSDAPCLPSRMALMTGRFGIHTGVVGHGGSAADPRPEGPDRGFRDRFAEENLPVFLRAGGFKTVAVSPFAERHGAWSFYAGFNEIHNPGKRGKEIAQEIADCALPWIARQAKSDNWFLYLNFWDAHTPYRAPEAFGNPFAGDPLPGWLTESKLGADLSLVGPHKPLEINMYDNGTDPRYPRQPGEIRAMGDLRRMIDGYDCGVRYMDTYIGRILNALADEGVLDDLAVIISADHGENLGELGIYGEHGTADQPTCRLPMIVKWPGGQAGRVATALHYHLDLAPTLGELLGIEPPPAWDGASYAPSILGSEDSGRDFLVLGQCAHVCQRSVRFGRWLYLRTYHDGYHLFPEEMLFDLVADPYEERDLAPASPEVCREAAYRLNQWHDKMMQSMPAYDDPLQRVLKEGGPYHAKGNLARYCDYLASTGRAYAIADLKRRHPEEFD